MRASDQQQLTKARPESLSQRTALRVLQAGAIACVLAVAPYQLFHFERFAVPKEVVLHAAAFLAVGLSLLSARRIPITLLDVLLGAYLFLALVSAGFATNHWLALRSVALIASGAAIFWSARAAARAGLGPALLTALAAGTVLGASTGLAQAYGVFTSVVSTSRAPGGTFGNRNFMAHLLAVGLPVLVWIALRSRTRTRHLLWCVGIVAVSAAMVLSRSRAAWLAVGLCAGGALALTAARGLKSVRFPRRRVFAVVLSAAVGVAGAVGLPNRLEWRSPTPYVDSAKKIVNYRSGSGRGRLIQYRNTLRMAVRHPLLGVGPGNWPVEYPLYASRGDPSYNPSLTTPTNPWPSSDWMAIAAEQGVLGFGLILAVLGALAVRAWRLALDISGTARGSGISLLLTILSLLVVGCFDAVIHLATPAFFFWAAAGCLVPAGPPLGALDLEGKARRALALAAVGVVGALLTVRSGRQLLAMRAANPGREPAALDTAAELDPGNYRIRMLAARAWLDRGDCNKALPHALAARRLFPNLPAPRRLLDRCGRRSSSI